jgi:hypothetical protein
MCRDDINTTFLAEVPNPNSMIITSCSELISKENKTKCLSKFTEKKRDKEKEGEEMKNCILTR